MRMLQFKKLFTGTPGVIIVASAACLLLVGGCALCGGGLLFPHFIRSQRAAAQQAKAEQTLREVRDAMQKKAAQDSAERHNAMPDGGNARESVDPE